MLFIASMLRISTMYVTFIRSKIRRKTFISEGSSIENRALQITLLTVHMPANF